MLIRASENALILRSNTSKGGLRGFAALTLYSHLKTSLRTRWRGAYLSQVSDRTKCGRVEHYDVIHAHLLLRVCELRVPTLRTLLQLLARCSQSNSPHGAHFCNTSICSYTKNLLATSTGLCNAQEGVSSQIRR